MERLRAAGIKTSHDGVEDYISLRKQWDRYVYMLAPKFAYDMSEIDTALDDAIESKEIFLRLDVQFKPDLHASELIGIIDELERKIHEQHPEVGHIFIEIERLKEPKSELDHH